MKLFAEKLFADDWCWRWLGVLALLIAFLLLTGCYTTSSVTGFGTADLRGATAKDSAHVQSRTIYVGMPVRFATQVLGPPDRLIRATQRGEVWRYYFDNRCLYTERCYQRNYSSTVYIRNGRIAELDNFPGYYLTP